MWAEGFAYACVAGRGGWNMCGELKSVLRAAVQGRSHIFQGDHYNTEVRIQTRDGVKEDIHFNLQDAFSPVQLLSCVQLFANP